MKKQIYFWLEEYFFDPKPCQKAISYLLLPLSFIYFLIVKLKEALSKKEDFDIPIISVGNLILGGSGKTPITIELAKDKKDVAVILRGYKRDSSDLLVVSDKGEIKCSTKESGDEAMLLATSLKNATIIVSKDRKEAIRLAKKMGAKVIFLDDAYSKKSIKKFDILIDPMLKNINSFTLPSGPYREPKSEYKRADLLLKEGIDFKRVVNIKNKTKDMILITAISKPQRLFNYINKDIPHYFFEDHYPYKKEEIEDLIKKHKATSILTTRKDYVKLKEFGFEISIIDLKIKIDPKKLKIVDNFIEQFDKIS